MGYVRKIVESGVSVADRTAGSYVEKARAAAAAHAPESTQKLEGVVDMLCARAMPIVDQVDTRVDSTLASAVEIWDQAQQTKEAQLQRAKGTVQLAQQATEEKLQLAKDVKTDFQAKLQETRESTEAKLRETTEAKLRLAKDTYEMAKTTAQEKTEAKVRLAKDTYESAKTQAQETKDAKLQEVHATIQMAKESVSEQYAAKKELVQRAKDDATKKYTTGKEAVISQIQHTKAEVQSQVQAVVVDGSVTKLSLVQALLERVSGTRFQHTTLRLVEAADLVLQKSLNVLPASMPRTFAELKSCLPERVAHSLNAAQAVEEPLRAKLEAAKKRASDLAGQASAVYGDVRGDLAEKSKHLAEKSTSMQRDVAVAATQAQQRVRVTTAAVSTHAQQRITTAKGHLQTEAQALVANYSEPTTKALVSVFGQEVVASGYATAASGYATARPLLPAAVVEWIAQVDGLD